MFLLCPTLTSYNKFYLVTINCNWYYLLFLVQLLKQLIVTLIVLVKLNFTSKINETINCYRRQLIVSTVKQLLFLILLIYLLCRCNILSFSVTLIVLLYLIPISIHMWLCKRVDLSRNNKLLLVEPVSAMFLIKYTLQNL